MPLTVNDKKIIPCPLITINKTVNSSNDGRPLSSTFRITLNGTLLPNRGSPLSYGWISEGSPPDESFNSDAAQHNSLLKKQEFLRQLFGKDGLKVTYSPPNSESIDFYARPVAINFDQDTWVIRSDYTIELETDKINRYGTAADDTFGDEYTERNITSIADSYSIQQREDSSSVVEINRTVSATASTIYSLDASGNVVVGTEAWQNAKAWVLDRLTASPFTSGISALAPTGYNSYNFLENESIDIRGGSYTRSQRFVFATGTVNETRQVSRSREYNRDNNFGPDYKENITVNGTIAGFDPTNNASGKITSAYTYWSVLEPSLGTLVGAYGPPITTSLTEDYTNGVLTYSHNYVNNNPSGNQYTLNYDTSFTNGQGLPNVVINGTINGNTPDEFFYPNNVSGSINRFSNALAGWMNIEPKLKNLAFAEYNLFGGSGYASSFGDAPSTKNISYNKVLGTISFNYNYAYVGSGNAANLFTNNWNIELSTPNAPTNASYAGLSVNASINGKVLGLIPTGVPEDPEIKLNNALSGWDSISGSLFTYVNNHFTRIGTNTPPLNGRYLNRVVAINREEGSLNYSASFNNLPAPSNTGVAIEDVTIDDAYANNIFAVQIIPGRNTGPIIQNIGTSNERRRTINVSLTMYPKATGYYWYATDKSTPYTISQNLISGLAPTGGLGTGYLVQGDSDNWNWKNGFYTRNISLVY